MSKTCQRCGAKCCTYFCFEIDKPDNYEEFEDIRWFLCHENIRVHIDEEDWFIDIANPCKYLGPNNRCKIYDDRPIICRGYSKDNCDHTGGDYGYEEHFHTPEQIDAYARKFLGKAAYERAQKKARAKFEDKIPVKPKKRKS